MRTQKFDRCGGGRGRIAIGASAGLAALVAALAIPGGAAAVSPAVRAPTTADRGEALLRLARAGAERRPRRPQVGSKVRAAQADLRRSLGDEAVVDVDKLTGTPRAIQRLDGTITGPAGGDPAGDRAWLGAVQPRGAGALGRRRGRAEARRADHDAALQADPPALPAALPGRARVRQRPVGSRSTAPGGFSPSPDRRSATRPSPRPPARSGPGRRCGHCSATSASDGSGEGRVRSRGAASARPPSPVATSPGW